MVPSVKGSAFQSVADDARRLVSMDVIERDALDPKYQPLLEQVQTPLSWVPISGYGALLDLLAKTEGGRDPKAYLRGRGRIAAARLLDGNYEAFKAGPGTWGRRTGETMLGIARLLYNFMEWSFVALPDDVCEVRVDGCASFPEAARETAHGFLQEYAERAAGQPVVVESARPRDEHIVYRIRLAGDSR
jgi:hypothetical protein